MIQLRMEHSKVFFGYVGLGDKTQAKGWLQKALEINKKMLGKEHPATIETYRNLRYLELINASDINTDDLVE